MSGMTAIRKQNISDWMQLSLLDVNTPVDENNTHTRWIIARSFFRGPLARIFMGADADSKRRTLKIFEQDREVVEDIKPIRVPLLADELSVKSDALQIAFRRACQRYKDRGWAIDNEQVRARDPEQRAMSIPSVKRTEASRDHWVIDTVPLTEPRHQRPVLKKTEAVG